MEPGNGQQAGSEKSQSMHGPHYLLVGGWSRWPQKKRNL
jgi:hypothetical protein